MPNYVPEVFTDQTASSTGTPLNAQNLNALVVSDSCLLNGTTPPVPTTSDVLAYGAQNAVIQNNTAGVDNASGVQFVPLAAGNITLSVASQDYYIDLNTNGTLTASHVNNGSGAPTQGNNTLRLWKVVTDSHPYITAVTLEAPTAQISGAMLQVPVIFPTGSPAVPSTTGHGGGSRVVLYPGTTGHDSDDYALGISPNELWVNLGGGGNLIRFYYSGASIGTLDKSGNLAIGGSETVGTGLTVSAGGAVITGNSSVTGTFHVISGIATMGGDTVLGAHLYSIASAPTIAIGTGVNGAGNAAQFIGANGSTDRRGVVSITAGASPTAGPAQLCRITFASAYSANPIVTVTPANANAASLGIYFSYNATTTFFDVYYTGTPIAAQAYEFTYIVEG